MQLLFFNAPFYTKMRWGELARSSIDCIYSKTRTQCIRSLYKSLIRMYYLIYERQNKEGKHSGRPIIITILIRKKQQKYLQSCLHRTRTSIQFKRTQSPPPQLKWIQIFNANRAAVLKRRSHIVISVAWSIVPASIILAPVLLCFIAGLILDHTRTHTLGGTANSYI